MFARRFYPGLASLRPLSLVLVLGLLVVLPTLDAVGQRPFRINDPFYRGETADRDFYDRLALTGEVSYRSTGSVQDDGVPTSSSDLAFRFRFDYELAQRFDLSAIFDAVGASGARQVTLSWLVLKYYRYLEETNSNYAFRLAVDPSANGQLGFPQVDLAFLYGSSLSPLLTTDFAIGLRRVNIGYAQFVPPEPLQQGDSFVIRPRPSVNFTRALGSEIHLMMNYDFIFDPAGSNLFLNLLGEFGSYDLVESPLEAGNAINIVDLGDSSNQAEDAVKKETAFGGGTIWMRLGVEFKRPSYRISPFLGAPLKQWTPDTEDDEWPVSRLHFGVQLMLR